MLRVIAAASLTFASSLVRLYPPRFKNEEMTVSSKVARSEDGRFQFDKLVSWVKITTEQLSLACRKIR